MDSGVEKFFTVVILVAPHSVRQQEVPQAAEACQKSFGNPDFEAAVIGFEK
jgi:hypothetical protein